jgi:hypothetical protein
MTTVDILPQIKVVSQITDIVVSVIFIVYIDPW